MNKYKNHIEKIASRAWKRKIGELGVDSVQHLVNSGVLNRTKELKGLNLGTNKILGKYNAKNFETPNKAVAHLMQSVKERTPDLVANKDVYNATKDQLLNMGIFGSPAAKNSKWAKSGVTHVSKHPRKKIMESADNLVNQLENLGVGADKISFKRNDREGKKWADAIGRRHEADEVRFGLKSMNKKKNKVMTDNGEVLFSTFGSHLTPKVLNAESANVAIAPKSTQKAFKTLRSYGMPGYSESDTMNSFSGGKFNYGKSGVYNKHLADKIEKETVGIAKKNFNAFL